MIIIVFTKQPFDPGAARVYHRGNDGLPAGKRAAATVVLERTIRGCKRHCGFVQEHPTPVTAHWCFVIKDSRFGIGCPWSLTHRPTEAFSSCFSIGPLPSPKDKPLFMKAVTEMVQCGVTRFAREKAEETAVAERIRAPLEGFLGWHDFGSEDGSYNKVAHPSVDEGTATERNYGPGFQPGTPNARTPSPSPSKSIQPSSLEVFITPPNARTPSPSPFVTPQKRRAPNSKTPPLSSSRSVQPSPLKAFITAQKRVVDPQSKTTTRVPGVS